MQENNKQLKWSIVTFILAALSVLAMFSQSRSLTVSGLLESLGESGPLAILAALICMAGYIVCEGIALWLMLRHNGYKKRPLDGIMYAAADIYCSAITPSATGGQPVCAWFMSRDGGPMGIITAILMIHLIMHSFASVTIGILSLIIDPSVFLGFSLLSKFFIVLGFLLLTGIAAIFIVLFSKEKEVYGIGCKIIAWLKKKNIIKRDAYWRDWTKNMLHECAESLQSMRGMGRFMGIIYLLNAALLGAVLLIGWATHGAQRWIDLGFTKFQPVELMVHRKSAEGEDVIVTRIRLINPPSDDGLTIGENMYGWEQIPVEPGDAVIY